MPRITNHKSFDRIQMQIQQNFDLPQILHGADQQDELKSMKLIPGNEYVVKLIPHGRITEEGFRDLSLEQRKCRLKDEVFEGASTNTYSKQNCKYDCQVSLATESCRCIPWDFISNEKNLDPCDLFGRTCFFDVLSNLTHDTETKCSHCIDECEKMEFKKMIIHVKPLKLVQNNAKDKVRFCNDYVCMDKFG